MVSTCRWWVVVPIKDTRRAKSRLASLGPVRRDLAIAMAEDTIDAVVGCRRVAGVLVVCERREDVALFARPRVDAVLAEAGGLNAAIHEGGDYIRALRPGAAIAVVPGDLPYLHRAELDAALACAESCERAVIGDRSGRGSTLTTAGSEVELRPRYGEDSLNRHVADGAVRLGFPAWSGLRRDVDVPGDLSAAPALGRRTSALLARWVDEGRKVSV